MLAWSCLPSRLALEHLCTTQVLYNYEANPPEAGLVTHRRLCCVVQMKVWAPKLPSPTIIVTGFAKKGLALTSNFPNLTTHNVRLKR